ncbi:hypothetical protein FN846DRAFT_1023623 [Sphaerosporella brunnea]|uniref:Uncharacterized protein n=1 Tax=Sphaerosporella brunnea TaxID=1250544 RepID=A0A5J5ENN7_9PEZI|nr:hypothetical protein FN846DRAFT_1023623 [Sphaerosporella brunnea]
MFVDIASNISSTTRHDLQRRQYQPPLIAPPYTSRLPPRRRYFLLPLRRQPAVNPRETMPPKTNIARIPDTTCENVRASPALRPAETESATKYANQRTTPTTCSPSLKLFPPPRPSRPWDALLRESTAYASQRRLRPLMPRLDQNHLAASAAAWLHRVAQRKQHKHLAGLLLDSISQATTLMATPKRPLEHPGLVDAVIAGLERIHEARVLDDGGYSPRCEGGKDSGVVDYWWMSDKDMDAASRESTPRSPQPPQPVRV